ncbi:MAG TPA: hypothetical protein VK168_15565 [Saprospiraceae bacterium]|nr:hypothetical protein [Saprospiraceae bacterium]
MKDLIFALLTVGLVLLMPACTHDEFTRPDPEPTDTIEMPVDTLSCEDTIEIFYPGTMENGYIKAFKTCREWKASGKAIIAQVTNQHFFINGTTFYPYIFAPGDTAFLNAEGIIFTVPKKVGKYPVANTVGFKNDTVTGGFVYMDDDVFLSDWNVDPAYTDNEFEILEIDNLNKRVKGKFNIHFIIDTTGVEYQLYPSKLYFHEGTFDVKIVDE